MPALAIDISEFALKVKDLIAGLKRDEEIIITASDQPVAKLIAVNGQTSEQSEAKPKRRRAGTAEGTFWMSPDFNEPLEEFKEYME
jgi:antitoxin (DNA-binding transcriptional repressor) of toxin-antitoxin stability system